jgi:hypothetical protein
MAQQVQNTTKSSILKYKTVIALVLLPVILALYVNGGNTSGIITTLSSGVFPAAMALFTWGIAVQQLVHIRRK